MGVHWTTAVWCSHLSPFCFTPWQCRGIQGHLHSSSVSRTSSSRRPPWTSHRCTCRPFLCRRHHLQYLFLLPWSRTRAGGVGMGRRRRSRTSEHKRRRHRSGHSSCKGRGSTLLSIASAKVMSRPSAFPSASALSSKCRALRTSVLGPSSSTSCGPTRTTSPPSRCRRRWFIGPTAGAHPGRKTPVRRQF